MALAPKAEAPELASVAAPARLVAQAPEAASPLFPAQAGDALILTLDTDAAALAARLKERTR